MLAGSERWKSIWFLGVAVAVSQRLDPPSFVAAERFLSWKLRKCGSVATGSIAMDELLEAWILAELWCWSQYLDAEFLTLQLSISGRDICSLGSPVVRYYSGCHSWKLSLVFIWPFLQFSKHLILCIKSFSLGQLTRVVSIICKSLTDIVLLYRLIQSSFYSYKRISRQIINKFENVYSQQQENVVHNLYEENYKSLLKHIVENIKCGKQSTLRQEDLKL